MIKWYFLILLLFANFVINAQTITNPWITFDNRNINAVALAIDNSGNIYTANQGISSVSKITQQGVVTKFWGNLDSSANPTAITIDKSGNIYTANMGNSTVSKLTPQGVVTKAWAILDTNAIPYSIAIDSLGNIYTANVGNNTISKITPQGSITKAWAILDSNAGPNSIAIDNLGNVYTANSRNNTISKITPLGVVSKVWANFSTSKNYSIEIALDNVGNVYTVNSSLTSNDAYVYKINSSGVISLLYTLPTNTYASLYRYKITLDKNQNIYITNAYSKIITKVFNTGAIQSYATLKYGPNFILISGDGYFYTSNGNSVSKVANSAAIINYDLSNNINPYGIASDSLGNIFSINNERTLSKYAHTLSKISTNGIVNQKWAFLDSSSINRFPMIVDRSGNKFVFNDSLAILFKIRDSVTISKELEIGATRKYNRTLITNDNSGNVYLAYSDEVIYLYHVLKFSKSGKIYDYEFWSNVSNSPLALCDDKFGNTYVGDGISGKINKIDSNGVITEKWADYRSGLEKIIADKFGNIYCTSTNSIRKLSSSGKVLQTWDGITNIRDFATDHLGNFYFLNTDPISSLTSVNRIDKNGVLKNNWVSGFKYPLPNDYSNPNHTILYDTVLNKIYILNNPNIDGTNPFIIKIDTCSTIPSTPIISLSGKKTICAGDSSILISNSLSGNKWYLNDTLIKDSTRASLIAKIKGNYSFKSEMNGCLSASSNVVDISINSVPAIPLAKDTVYCNGSITDTLKVIASTGNTLQWYGTNASGGIGTSVAIKPISNIIGITNYYVSQVNILTGCEGPRAKINVTINPVPASPLLTRDVNNFLVSNVNRIIWYKDGAILQDTSQKFKPTLAGTYTAKTVLNGCLSASSFPYYYLVTDIVNISADEFIKIAPNPFINQLNFDFFVKGYQKLNMEVFDLASGSKVVSKQNLIPGNPIYLGQLSTGTYVIKVTSNDLKVSYQFKMVKL
jgi:streptogramin lyase